MCWTSFSIFANFSNVYHGLTLAIFKLHDLKSAQVCVLTWHNWLEKRVFYDSEKKFHDYNMHGAKSCTSLLPLTAPLLLPHNVQLRRVIFFSQHISA